MAERTDQNAINSRLFKGRRQIVTNIKEITKENLPSIINNALVTHLENVREISILEDYYLGKQQIVNRSKDQRPDINNKITINNAYAITRIINGIAYGNQIQIVPRKQELYEKVNTFNEFSINEQKYKNDMEISHWQSICGTAYELLLPGLTTKDGADATKPLNVGKPYNAYVLNPKTTFCIYSNTINKKRLVGVTYLINYDSQGSVQSYDYTIYTQDYTYTYTSTKDDGTIADDFKDKAMAVPRLYSKRVPIVEFPNDMFNQGDYEMTISLMDSINLLTSDRLNQFVQNVCYIYKMINCEFDEGIDDIWDVIDKGYVQLKTGGDAQNKAEFDVLSTKMDNDSNVQVLANYLQDKLELVVGIPNRQTRGGGGDTGEAVFLRNGLDDTHTRIAIKHAFRIASEMEIAELKLDITNNLGLTDLNINDIDIKITPVRHDNSQQTAQALQIYDKISFPRDEALSLLNITQDPTSLAIKWEKNREKAKEELPADPSKVDGTDQDINGQ